MTTAAIKFTVCKNKVQKIEKFNIYIYIWRVS